MLWTPLKTFSWKLLKHCIVHFGHLEKNEHIGHSGNIGAFDTLTTLTIRPFWTRLKHWTVTSLRSRTAFLILFKAYFLPWFNCNDLRRKTFSIHQSFDAVWWSSATKIDLWCQIGNTSKSWKNKTHVFQNKNLDWWLIERILAHISLIVKHSLICRNSKELRVACNL